MASINEAFINALLADAAYVDDLRRGLSGEDLASTLAGRSLSRLVVSPQASMQRSGAAMSGRRTRIKCSSQSAAPKLKA
jgi:hypothetical protein